MHPGRHVSSRALIIRWTRQLQYPHAGITSPSMPRLTDMRRSAFPPIVLRLPGSKTRRSLCLRDSPQFVNLGAGEYSDVAIRDGIAAGDIDGTRMLVSGPQIGIAGGHCD